MATEQITISRPAPYLEAAGQTYLDLLIIKITFIHFKSIFY